MLEITYTINQSYYADVTEYIFISHCLTIFDSCVGRSKVWHEHLVDANSALPMSEYLFELQPNEALILKNNFVPTQNRIGGHVKAIF
jgi:hypothetical protein